MSATATRNDVWLAGIEAGCERLVHPDVTDASERGRQRRFLGVALAAPFVLAPALMPALTAFLSRPGLLAAVCAVFAISWTCATLVAGSGRRNLGEPLALVLGAIAVALAIAGGGGLAYPAALLALGIGFETWWIGRTGRHAARGAVAAAAVLPLAAVAAQHFGMANAGVSAWAWLAPGLYFASVAPRAGALLRRDRAAADAPSLQETAQAFGVAAIRVTASGEVADASEEAGELLGLPAGLLVGRSLFERIHVGDRVALMNALAGAGPARRSVDLRVRVTGEGGTRRNERFLPVSLEMVNASAQSDGIIAIVRDNSVAAKLREELEAARQTADSIEIAKNRFLAAVSHELRTPLNAIIGFSDMMLNGMAGSLTERQREYAGLISHSGSHLLSVVNAILDVSKIESGAYSIRPEPFAVADAVELCRSMMAQQAESRGLEFTVSVRPDIRELSADRRAVQQIIINLLSNAIKFTPAGGSVSLDVFRLGAKMSFVIADSGIGIAEEDLGRLGRPFTQISNDITRQFEGAGLGLSLVKGLVALHEGELMIESAPGEGTVVTVTLPMDGPQSRQQESKAAMPPAAAVHAMELKVKDETVRKTA